MLQIQKICLPVGQGLDFRPLLLIDGFVSLNEGEVGLWCDVGRPSVSTIKNRSHWVQSFHIRGRDDPHLACKPHIVKTS